MLLAPSAPRMGPQPHPPEHGDPNPMPGRKGDKLSLMGVDVITQGRERARAGPWRGDPDVAYLAPAPNAPVPSPEFVRHCLDDLARRGFRAVVTSALSVVESSAFLAAGFDVHERL